MSIAVTPPPVDAEAWAFALLRDLGGISVWAVDGGTDWPHRVWRTTVQVDVRASSKKRARDRAVEALSRLLDQSAPYPQGGVIAAVTEVTGPMWLPDDDGAPRYVLRVNVHAHGQTQIAQPPGGTE